MQIKLFSIPIIGGERQEEALNTFLKSNKILQVEQQLAHHGQYAHWCFSIQYIASAVSSSTKSKGAGNK